MKKMELMKSFGEQLLLIQLLKVFSRKISLTLHMLKSQIQEKNLFKIQKNSMYQRIMILVRLKKLKTSRLKHQ